MTNRKTDIDRMTARPFDRNGFVAAVCAGGVVIFAVGLVLDRMLIAFGVELSPWRDAFFSGLFGVIFGLPGILAVWRIGVVTLRQYILCALILFAPLTVLSLFALAAFEDVVIAAPWAAGGAISAHDLAFTVYVRIARSAVLTPFFIFAFWYLYHRRWGFGPRVG